AITNLAEGLGRCKNSPMRKRWRPAELSRQNFYKSDLRLFYVSWPKHNDYGPVLGLYLTARNKKWVITSA
ncbi:hypothetical protein V5H41_27835, partial [Salmonella enterica]